MECAVVSDGLELGKQRILFVGGKGGVGKTTLSSSLALRLADQGERCLLVSTDPAHSLGDLFDRPIGDQPELLEPNLWGMEIDPDGQVEKHLNSVKETMRELVKPELYPEIDRQMSLARFSPGAVEAAMLERMADLMIGGSEKYDRVIFDTAPTGHTLRLLSLPEIMGTWIDGLLGHRDRSDALNRELKELGPRAPADGVVQPKEIGAEVEEVRASKIRTILMERREKFARAKQLLLEPGVTGFIIVLIPEKLPILESHKAVEALNEFRVPILGMVVNRVLPTSNLGSFFERRRDQEATYLKQIDTLFAGLPRLQLPLMTRDVEGLEGLRSVGEYLVPQQVQG